MIAERPTQTPRGALISRRMVIFNGIKPLAGNLTWERADNPFGRGVYFSAIDPFPDSWQAKSFGRPTVLGWVRQNAERAVALRFVSKATAETWMLGAAHKMFLGDLPPELADVDWSVEYLSVKNRAQVIG